MKRPVHVVHLTPHLGGGIGKTLLALAEAQRRGDYAHSFLLLERPEKTQFVDALLKLGCRIEVASEGDPAAARALLAAADIVQLEWWNHPATFEFLCRSALPAMRLLVWCHVSGLRTPLIPETLFEAAGRLLFTSECSMQSPTVALLGQDVRARIGMVSSGVGLAAPLARESDDAVALRVGYVGSLNFSKLHPRFVDFLAAVDVPDFRVRIWGDVQNRQALLDDCERAGKRELIEFAGYTTDVAEALASLDVIAYLLNPNHYGTGENALLEAMSAGVVPVVLRNPAEAVLVQDGHTGLVVDGPRSFAAALRRLADDPQERRTIGRNAAEWASSRFTPRAMGESMAAQYVQLLSTEKQTIDFRRVLGAEAADWFLSCQEHRNDFVQHIRRLAGDPFASHNLFEASKGSLLHFGRHFPEDGRLQAWRQLAGESVAP